ncbi:glycosyltransferase family 4 protein [Kocuria rosea]|uniref:glycosyltransferase family 4 protein n=1 Tax=Kocuria rosea TaxID=1275 RepID=UPI0025421CCD|nr:glycosyltransferase family 4 protein [Kocuria rosea]WIG16332.1 glycosyltransferase family 4 protein [Kocuria rosea]
MYLKSFEGLRSKRVLVLNWRDIKHPLAGGAERYMHEISRRWVTEGVDVTWFTGRGDAQGPIDNIDGVKIVRMGGTLSLYPMAALKLVSRRGDFDAIVDCQNGIPFFSPLFAGAGIPVVQVIHHVHQEQFSTRFSAPMAAVGRFLEGTAARWVYGERPLAAVSPSTRRELRRQLRFSGPIFVVPNGTVDVPETVGPRDPDPTITVVTRLVPHKRVDLLLGHLAVAAQRVPRLRVNIVGDGPDRARLQQIAVDLGLHSTVKFHGYQTDATRDQLLNGSWLTAITSAAEGWGLSVIETAAWGVPCLALRVPGVRDSVIDGETGWLVDDPKQYGEALIEKLHMLSNESYARGMAEACQAWARCFDWDRSASLLAGVVQEAALRIDRSLAKSRGSRTDLSTLAQFPVPSGMDLRARLRPTDEAVFDGNQATVLFNGCDEFDTAQVLAAMGVVHSELRPVETSDLLAGPAGRRAHRHSADHGATEVQ